MILFFFPVSATHPTSHAVSFFRSPVLRPLIHNILETSSFFLSIFDCFYELIAWELFFLTMKEHTEGGL